MDNTSENCQMTLLVVTSHSKEPDGLLDGDRLTFVYGLTQNF
jgi:hypothetical protein